MKSLFHLLENKTEIGENCWILCANADVSGIAKLDTLEELLLLCILYLWMANYFWVMSKLIFYIFLLLQDQKLFQNHCPSKFFLRQHVFAFSSKIGPHETRADVLYRRGWNKWINRHSTPLISVGKVQKWFTRSYKLESSTLLTWNLFYLLSFCSHINDCKLVQP